MIAEAALAIEAVSSAIALFDKLYPRIVRIFNGTDPTPPSFKIEKQGNEIVATRHGQVVQRVTYKQLMVKLPPNGVSMVEMYERSMEAYTKQIESVYPLLATLPPIERAQTEIRLKMMTEGIKSDLLGVLDLTMSLGFDLDDHYRVAYHLIEQWKDK